ncbi:hypothetical protein EAG_01218 [Camponotus floridanus]|uniref:Uncharacterized protein n=1 Tax=Camponotus floridanus TaxID=104421 RepID=E2AD53_CAMFO|nr:hypothetical protein EAG_01218 [Camponotus floridanus]
MPSPRVTSQITLYGQFAGANTNLIIGNETCYVAHVRIGASTETEDAYQKLICERLHKYSVGWWWKENGLSLVNEDVYTFGHELQLTSIMKCRYGISVCIIRTGIQIMNRSSHLSQSNPRIDKLLGETFLSQPVLFAFNFTIFSQNTSFTPISSAGGKAPNARLLRLEPALTTSSRCRPFATSRTSTLHLVAFVADPGIVPDSKGLIVSTGRQLHFNQNCTQLPIHPLTHIYRFSIIWESLDLNYFFKLASTSKTFPIEFGRIGRWCQTNQGISVVDEDNELKFSKLFLAV